MKIGLIAGVATISAAAGANAAIIVTTGPTGSNSLVRANLDNGVHRQLVQRVSFDGQYDLNSIEIYGRGADFDLALSSNIGTGANDASDIVWSQSGITTGPSNSWLSFDASGVSVEAGEYYLIMTSQNASGGLWATVDPDNPDVVGVNSAGLVDFENGGPNSITTHEFSNIDSLAFATQIDGTLVPAPGAAALLGLAGLTAVRRRR